MYLTLLFSIYIYVYLKIIIVLLVLEFNTWQLINLLIQSDPINIEIYKDSYNFPIFGIGIDIDKMSYQNILV